MTDERAYAAPGRALWWVVAGGVAIAAAATAAALLLHEPAEQLADLVAPIPFLALVAVAILSALVAWMRGAPPDLPMTRPFAWWWLSRLALLVALLILLAAWIVPFFVGLAVARTLFQAFLLVLLISVMLMLAGMTVRNVAGAIRGA